MITTVVDRISTHVMFKINKNLFLTATIQRNKFLCVCRIYSFSYEKDSKYLSKHCPTTKQYLN